MAKDPSKTEKPTPKRINKARKEGNVAKSQELPKVVSIVTGLFIISLWVSHISQDLTGMWKYFFTQAPSFEVNDANVASLGMFLAKELAYMLFPILGTMALGAFIILRVQVGKLWTTKVFKPKLSKFNPISGMKRMFFSADTFMRLFKSLSQAIFIGIAPWMVVRGEMDTFINLYYLDAAGVIAYILEITSRIVFYALVPMLALAIFDWWYTRHKYIENLKMTKAEIKDEHKQSEGDMQVKQKMRQKMQAMVMRNLKQHVPKADVIITNPTHIAVALRYDPKEYPAPVILAMGADKVAERIKEIAKEHNVPIRQNVPLARALYEQAEAGDMIPADLFQAVASILAQIWQTKGKTLT